MDKQLRRLLNRKTYDVTFEESSGRRDIVVLNADNLKDLKREFKTRFKGWKFIDYKYHK